MHCRQNKGNKTIRELYFHVFMSCVRLMSCVLPPQGQYKFSCPALTEEMQKCGAEWSYTEVRRLAVLTVDEMQQFEESLARLAATEYCDFKAVSGLIMFYVFKKEKAGTTFQLFHVHTPLSHYSLTVSWLQNLRGKRGRGQSLFRLHYLPSKREAHLAVLLAVSEAVEGEGASRQTLRQRRLRQP